MRRVAGRVSRSLAGLGLGLVTWLLIDVALAMGWRPLGEPLPAGLVIALAVGGATWLLLCLGRPAVGSALAVVALGTVAGLLIVVGDGAAIDPWSADPRIIVARVGGSPVSFAIVGAWGAVALREAAGRHHDSTRGKSGQRV